MAPPPQLTGGDRRHTGRPAGTALAVGTALAAAAGLAAVVGLAVTVAVRGGEPLGTDLAVRDLVTAAGTGDGVRLAAAVTQLGAGPVLYPVLLIICGWTAVRRSPRELLPVPVLAAGQVIELVLFATVRRPSPGAGLHTGLDAGLLETTLSSGHSAAAVLGWGLVVRQLTRSARAAWAAALLAGVVVGATRVYLGMHWLSDAVAGILVGAVLLAAAFAVLAAVDRRRPAPQWRMPRWLTASRWAWSIPALIAAYHVTLIVITPPDQRLKDFLVYHGAGGPAGAGDNVYAFRTVFDMPFTYPPFAALVMEPLSRMPLGLAQTLWTLATLAAVVALGPTALRPVVDRLGLPLTTAALLVAAPVRSHLRFGQVGVFLVLLVALDLLQRKGFRGWGLGLAVAVKLTPAVYLPWLLVSRKWKRLGGTLAWAGGSTLLGLALLWPSTGDYLFRASRDTTRFGRNDIPGNQSVRGMLLRSLDDPVAERVWLVLAVLLVAAGVYQAWRCERSGNRLAAVGVLAAMSVAVSPISWVHHLVWLAFPIAALAAADRWRLVTAWFLVLVISFPFLGGILTNIQGLTAVAAVFLLPRLTGGSGRYDGSCSSRPAPRPCTTPPRASAKSAPVSGLSCLM